MFDSLERAIPAVDGRPDEQDEEDMAACDLMHEPSSLLSTVSFRSRTREVWRSGSLNTPQRQSIERGGSEISGAAGCASTGGAASGEKCDPLRMHP